MATSTLPTLGTGASADGQSVLLPGPNSIENIPQAPAGDSLDTYVASGGPAGGH
jgi:polyisoprenyl-teichoic acid--peptidoglycan teichoic acid transferase